MLLKGFRSTTPGLYENSLIWTPYDGFANGLNRYEVVRKESNDESVIGQPLATISSVSETHEDDVSDMFDSPGIFCYQVLALETLILQRLFKAQRRIDLFDGRSYCVDPGSLLSPNGDDLNEWFPWPPGESNAGLWVNSRFKPKF